MLEIKRATPDDAQQHAIEQVVLDATSLYSACGDVGDEQAVYRSPSGLVLACVPMVKRLRVMNPA